MGLSFVVPLLASAEHVRGYLLPVSRETGPALEVILHPIRSLFPSILNLQALLSRQPEKRSIWDSAKEKLGMKPKEQPFSLMDPMIVCNSYIVLSILAVIFFNILVSKKYFTVNQHEKPTVIPFLDRESDDTDSDCTTSVSRSCVHCSCTLLKDLQESKPQFVT